jgi:hypothetical protein
VARYSQNILRLEVAIYNVQRVEMFESKEQFSGIESRAFLVEFLLPLQVVEQLSSINISE